MVREILYLLSYRVNVIRESLRLPEMRLIQSSLINDVIGRSLIDPLDILIEKS